MRVKKVTLSFLVLSICFIFSVSSNLASAKEHDNQMHNLVTIGTVHDLGILIDETAADILTGTQKDNLVVFTEQVLSQCGLREPEISVVDIVGPKNILVEHTCSPMGPYYLDSYYATVYLKDNDVIIGHITYFHCGQTNTCKYVAAITVIYN